MPRLLLVFCLGIVADAANAKSLERIRRDGIVRIGVNPEFPMHSFSTLRNYNGFDIDIGEKLREGLRVRKVQFRPIAAADRVNALREDRIDIALGAFTRIPEREALVDFSIALHPEVMDVLLTDRLADIRLWPELNRPDIRIVDMEGNASVSFIREYLPLAHLVLVKRNADMVRSIANGKADAMVENTSFFMAFTEAYGNIRWRRLREPIQLRYCGVGVSKGNAALLSAVNDIVRELHWSGYIKSRWDRWYPESAQAPAGARHSLP
jgi:polar amino acid transport system substrate-binding protein